MEDMMEMEEELGELTPEMLEILEEEEAKLIEERNTKLEQIANALDRSRKEAVDGRKNSGIETIWDEDEDAYEGIDDANRHEFAVDMKPEVGGSSTHPGPDEFGSTILINITRPYVDAAAAKVVDMLLPTDDRPWAISPTPVPELDQIEQQHPEMGPQLELLRWQALQVAEKAEHQIEDWLTECQWHNEMRLMIEDAARIGTGVIKGPYPMKRRVRKFSGGILQFIETIVPFSKAVNPRNLFPDPSCGTSIHKGSYIWERDWITGKQLRDLKGVSGYLDDQIDACLQEGPDRRNVEDDRVDGASLTNDTDRFEIWYYHGQLNREDLDACGVDDLPEDMEVFPAIGTLVNGRLIKASMSPLDSGEFPYDVIPWQRRQGMPWGFGVARHIRSPQKMLTGAVREMMDNAALTSGPQIVSRKGVVKPANGIWEIVPRKLWWLTEDSMAKAQEAFMAIDIPNQQQQMLNIIEYALRMAEDSAGLPMLMQGQQGKAPDTVGGMEILNNNAHTVLRRLARNMDNMITEPHIRRYYEWILMYGPEEAQGDLMIDAQGSSALVERNIQNQAIQGMGELVMNPIFGIDPQKWFSEMLKAQRLDPKRFQYEEGEGPPPIPPEVQQQVQEMQQMIQQLQEQNQQLQTRALGHEARAQSHLQGKQFDAQSRLQQAQINAQNRQEIEHLRGQYRLELEGLKAQLGTVDLQLKGMDKENDRGKLELQRMALMYQIEKSQNEMNERMREFDAKMSNPVLDQGPISPQTGSLKGVIERDRYGMIPDAVG